MISFKKATDLLHRHGFRAVYMNKTHELKAYAYNKNGVVTIADGAGKFNENVIREWIKNNS